MKTHYLKAESRDAMIAAMDAAGMWHEDDHFLPASRGDALDEIGTINKETGVVVLVDGIPTPQVEPIPGYHANLMLHGEFPPELAGIEIPAPANPVRVWA